MCMFKTRGDGLGVTVTPGAARDDQDAGPQQLFIG